MLKKVHASYYQEERLHHEFSLSYPHSKRNSWSSTQVHLYNRGITYIYFLAKNPRSYLWLFGYQQKTRAQTHKKNSKNILLCDRVFLCDSVFKNIQKEKYEHQMFTRCQHETTSIFLLVDITKCFSPRHGNTHVRM